jgi:formylglycine-generating enzyme required for sulfatase activity
MFIRRTKTILWLMSLVLIAACGGVEPAATPVAPVPTPRDPTPSALPLTATPVQVSPTATVAVDDQGSALYLGQTPPGLRVELFAPGIVSIEEGKEYKIAISPDLQEIFFTRRTPGSGDDRLWHSRLVNGQLTVPELAPFTYDGFETDACFTPDGTRLYFNSPRPLPGEEAESSRLNVWFVERSGEGWGQPQFLGPPLNDYRPVYFSIANDGTLYFTRSSPRGIYYAEPEDGQYGEAHRLPDEINSVREVAHPAVAPDESYLVVDSAYEQGGRLVGSLYVSFRRADGSWTEAASLHEALGASESDVYASPRISPDGEYLFFERYDQATDRADIFWVRAEIVQELAAGPSESTAKSSLAGSDATPEHLPMSGSTTVAPALGQTWIRPADGMVMVHVAGGSFLMGSDDDDLEAVPDELPHHRVSLDAFWIDQTEVTNAQFVQFLNEQGNGRGRGSQMIILDQGYTQISQVDDRFVTKEVARERPVVMVTWHGAAAYCAWAGGRLPTEAEWEYAARGPEGNRYPWGNAPPTCDLANYGRCIGVPVEADRHPDGASWCGALDMAGNVWEWVADRFGPYSGLPQENPTGTTSGEVPVLRGGGWHSPSREIRAAYRQHDIPAAGSNG